MAAIAGVFCPTILVATNDINNARLAAITGGGTVAKNAARYAATADLAWLAVCSACAAVVSIHATYGAADAAIVPEPAPAYIRPEFTSGGNTPKSTTTSLPSWSRGCGDRQEQQLLQNQPPHKAHACCSRPGNPLDRRDLLVGVDRDTG